MKISKMKISKTKMILLVVITVVMGSITGLLQSCSKNTDEITCSNDANLEKLKVDYGLIPISNSIDSGNARKFKSVNEAKTYLDSEQKQNLALIGAECKFRFKDTLKNGGRIELIPINLTNKRFKVKSEEYVGIQYEGLLDSCILSFMVGDDGEAYDLCYRPAGYIPLSTITTSAVRSLGNSDFILETQTTNTVYIGGQAFNKVTNHTYLVEIDPTEHTAIVKLVEFK